MIPTLRRLSLVAIAGAVSLATGCADLPSGTGAPLSPADAGPSLSRSQVSPLARYQQKPQITVAWARTWIGPEGGRLDFRGFAIDVPAGAVDRVTQFSIRLPVDPQGSERVVAEFGPHGATFDVPVTIEFPYRGTSIEGSPFAKVVWWDGAWVDMGGTVTADGERLSTTTDHFSVYGTTEERGGGITVSGG
jgi:hypothetical protein